MKSIKIIFAGQGGAGIGQMASGIFKSVMGIGQIIGGAVGKAKAQKYAPQQSDPNEVALVDVLRRLRKGYQSGSEAATYRNTINQGFAVNANKIAALSGGNIGEMISGLSTAQAGAGESYNVLAGSLEKNRLSALGMESAQVNKNAQTKRDARQVLYLQKMGNAMSNLKAGQSNWIAGVEEFGAGADSFWGGGGMMKK